MQTDHLLLLQLLSIVIAVASADLDQDLTKSLEKAMHCSNNKDLPKGPVMAVSPARFVQIVVILHKKFKTPSCGQTPNIPIKVSNPNSWPFCVFGRCEQSHCQCAESFKGSKCGTYTKKCWLMYCFLSSCNPLHQSLHCSCDPSLYGTRVSTGIYWYNNGKSSKYKPPPKGWEDQPFEAINLKENAAIQMGNNGQRGGSSGQNGDYSGQRGSQNGGHSGQKGGSAGPNGGLNNQKGGSSNQRKGSYGEKGGSSAQRPGVGPSKQTYPGRNRNGPSSFLGGKTKTNKFSSNQKPGSQTPNSGSKSSQNFAGETKEALENTDEEEALEELEESSSALKLTKTRLILIAVIFINFQMV